MTTVRDNTGQAGAVLVVDDVDDERAVLRAAFTGQGFRVSDAATGRAAIDAAVDDVDAVVLDLGLPDVPGLEVLDSIRDRPDPPPVIIHTGACASEATACLHRGAHDFVSKPARLEELIARVGAAVRLRNAYRSLRSANENLARLAMRDALTGLANRRSGLEELTRMVATAQRYDRPLCVLMADVDRFKSVNDRYGHPIGDEVLRTVSWRLIEQIRTSDVAVRWGGEEFAVLMPDLAPGDAGVVAERIRSTIADTCLDFDGRSLPVTLSAGWTTYVAGDTPEAMINRADAALYRAKRAGRNAVLSG